MLRSTSTDFRPSVAAISHLQVRAAGSEMTNGHHHHQHGGGSMAPLGINPRWHGQLLLLGLNLMCCGGIVGLSRLLPQLAEERFYQRSYSAVLLFICFFGLFKAIFNLLVGTMAEAFGRRPLLLAGWALSFATPLVILASLAWSASWSWIICATALLGASQGLCTSTVVIMVMDIIPQRARGISMGVLECTIYVSLGLCALLANALQARWHDFRYVLAVHFGLCAIGLLAAMRAKETRAMPTEKSALAGGLDDDAEEEEPRSAPAASKKAGGARGASDPEAIGMNQRPRASSSSAAVTSDHEATFPAASANETAAGAAATLQWKSLLQDEADNVAAIAAAAAAAAATAAAAPLDGKKSILPVLAIHTIPASPFPDFPSTNSTVPAAATAAAAASTNGQTNGGAGELNATAAFASALAATNAAAAAAAAAASAAILRAEASSTSHHHLVDSAISPRRLRASSAAGGAAPGNGGRTAGSSPVKGGVNGLGDDLDGVLHGRRPSLSSGHSTETISLLRGGGGASGGGENETRSAAHPHSHAHAGASPSSSSSSSSATATFCATFRSSLVRTFSSSVLRAILQAGFFNNFKDGVLWGVLPSFFATRHHVRPGQLGYLLTAYPMVWGLGQLVTGRLSDQMGRGKFIIVGLAMQGLGIVGLVGTPDFVAWVGHLAGIGSVPQTAAGSVQGADSAAVLTATVLDDARFVVWLCQLLGIGFGTALSYPVLQAYIGDVVPAVHRASTIGVYRLCRDLGYAIGGLLSGFVADVYGVEHCLEMMAVLLLLSAAWSWIALPKDETEAWVAKKEAR